MTRNRLDSFPSGHAACSSASAVFLTLYLNGKAKTFADHTAPFCIVVLTLLPLLGAGIIAAIMVAVNVRSPKEFPICYL